MNNRWNRTRSGNLNDRLRANPEEWANYHTLYSQARHDWSLVPFEDLGKELMRGSRNLVVADFGCGEDLLGKQMRGLGFRFHSFDHIAYTDDVTEVDIGSGVPLDDGEVDVVILSLALMGANHGDYLCEAARVLAYDGVIRIVEAASRFSQPLDEVGIVDRMERLGFGNVHIDRKGHPEFVFIRARRTDAEPQRLLNLIEG
jgi:hypothetical protein